MKILYLSCHEILQWDECMMLMNLGHQVFCPGSFVEPDNAGDQGLRPGLPKCEGYDALMEEWHTFASPGIDNKERLTVEFVKKFDAVILMHLPRWMHANWSVFKKSGVPIVWRTIGQSIASNEKEMLSHRRQGMKIVRYSPMEKSIPGYIGADAFIRFCKDPEEFKGWAGDIREIITFGQHMAKRDPATNFKEFEQVTRGFPRKLYGPGSEELDWGMGKVPYADLKKAMQDYRAYFYTGTWPASYTLNFIEAMMTGMPMVCIGPKKGHPHGWFRGHDLYEIPNIITNGVNGFWSDSQEELKGYISQLLEDENLARKMSEAGRKRAIELFGKDAVAKSWSDFLETL